MAKNLQPVITELHKAFDLLNKEFYENSLPQVVIAIRSQGKRKGVNGWFTPDKTWTDGEEEKHEIVITAETLNRPFMDIMRTLHHEMIHLFCQTNGLEDTSRQGKYHNKVFRDECLKRGFWYPDGKPDRTIGWSYAELKPETEELIGKWDLDADVFGIARKSYGGGSEGTKKKSNIIKWTCPCCGAVVRSSKFLGIKLYCMNDKTEDGEDKEPCAVALEPEIPDNFNGKLTWGNDADNGDDEDNDDDEA